MELVFLGTGAGLPSKERNVTSVALKLLQQINEVWLFDCGEATQHQILKTSIKPRKITKIFITHLHGDHIYGLPGLLSSRSFQDGTSPLTIYGPKGIKNYVETSLAISETHLNYQLNIIEFTEGTIISDDNFTVECRLLKHGINSYGFRIIEADRIGELLVDELKADGIHPGPIYKEIKDNERTTLEDGRVIKRSDYIGPTKKGKCICIFGDTIYDHQHIHFAREADVLVHEATFASDDKDLAKNYNHTTTTEAATLAKEAHVKTLVLTHISSRYQRSDYEQLLHEAKTVFSNTYLANDLKVIPII